MPVSLNCPQGHRLTVSRRYAGQLVPCPQCGARVRIPSRETLDRKLNEQRLPVHPLAAYSAPGKSPGKPATQARLRPPPSPPLPVVGNGAAGVESRTESPAREPPAAPGKTSFPQRRWTSLAIGLTLAIVAIAGTVPAVREITEYAQSDRTVPVARWAWLALFHATVQIGYALYALQFSDWTTAWLAALASAAGAAGYAVLLGATYFNGGAGQVVQWLELQDLVPAGHASRWCLAMASLGGVYAYFAGRAALNWRRAWRTARSQVEPRPAGR